MLVCVLGLSSIPLRLTPALHHLLPWAVLIVTSVAAANAVQAWAEHYRAMSATEMVPPNYADARPTLLTISDMDASPTTPAVTCWTTHAAATDIIRVHGHDEISELYHELQCNENN